MPKTNQSTIEPLEDFGCHNQSPYRRLRKRDRSGENVQGLASANQVFCRSLLSIHSSATTFSRRYTRRDTKKNEARVIQDISRHIVPRVLLHSVTPGCFGGPDSSQVKSPAAASCLRGVPHSSPRQPTSSNTSGTGTDGNDLSLALQAGAHRVVAEVRSLRSSTLIYR
jgi:hypothetical protein